LIFPAIENVSLKYLFGISCSTDQTSAFVHIVE